MGAFHEPDPGRTPNAQHRTPNVEGCLRERFCIRRSGFGVRRSASGSGSWARCMRKGERGLPMNRAFAPSRLPHCVRPAGTAEKSPPFQRWVGVAQHRLSPAGAKESVWPPPGLLPSLAGLLRLMVLKPTDESVGYCRVSLRDRVSDRQESVDGRRRLAGSWSRCMRHRVRGLSMNRAQALVGARSTASHYFPQGNRTPCRGQRRLPTRAALSTA